MYLHRKVLIILIAGLALSACTLRIGSATRLKDQPAPTSIPLPDTGVQAAPQAEDPDKIIRLPDGFSITVFADGLQQPRMLAVGPDGQLYAAESGANRIIRLPDANGDGLADAIEVIANDMHSPSSLAFFQDGSLYVGETTRVLRLSDPKEQGVYRQRQTVISDLPEGGHHTRTVRFSPDFTSLFVSIGSSCNTCIEEDKRRAAIVRYNPDGGGEMIYAHGLRNAVGITFRPGTNELWATNNGSDMLGDDLPPETINLVQPGDDFGWPRCHAGRIVDPDFGAPGDCDNVARPAVEMQAHSAPLGLTFYTGQQFPAEYQGGLFVAFHGSWNRTQPTGYQVVFIPFQDGQPGPVQDFASGWLQDSGSSWGRPVDVITGSDGSLYVSDDGGGVIYQIYYNQP